MAVTICEGITTSFHIPAEHYPDILLAITKHVQLIVNLLTWSEVLKHARRFDLLLQIKTSHMFQNFAPK